MALPEDRCTARSTGPLRVWLLGLMLAASVALLLPAAATAFISTGDGGWLWQNPLPQGNYLSDVTFVDAHHGWSVGQDGTILTTTDGGATWSAQSSGTTEWLSGVSFPDASHGWAVGGSGTILATSNGGAHWTAQTSGTTLGLVAVSFPDASHGWAVGWDFFADQGIILATSDGGVTWSVQKADLTGEALSSVCFADDSHGWAVGSTVPGSQGIILATSDGGVTWTQQDCGTTSSLDLDSASFSDASHGWIVGAQYHAGPGTWTGAVLTTSDGGATWTQQYSGGVDWLYGVSFPDASHGWAVGYGGTILATSDGGATWSAQNPGTTQPLTSVCFADDSHGWAVGYDSSTDQGLVLATSDGGATWTQQDLGTAQEELCSVCFADASHGWAVGERYDPYTNRHQGVILCTADGGATWATQNSGAAQEELQSVCFADDSHGWAVGYDPTDGSLVLATSDGGATWTQQDSGGSDWLYGVSFPNDSHGWAVGGSGTILATADGGAHWATQSSGTTAWLDSVSFADASHGWAVGDSGTILATSDGGATWTAQNSGMAQTRLDSVCFADASHGWAVGGYAILATTTGGQAPASSDTTPPTTTVAGADDLWHNTPVTLTFSATDNPGGSGVDYTEFKLDAGDWTQGTSVTVPAPADHSGDGVHTVAYRSADKAGNVEVAKSCQVKIDTTAPTVRTGRFTLMGHGRPPVVHFAVSDALSPTATVSIKAARVGLQWHPRPVVVWSGTVPADGSLQWARLACHLRRGTYRCTISATDLAGNQRVVKIAGSLVVR